MPSTSTHQKVSGFGEMTQKKKTDGNGSKGKTDDAYVGGFPGKLRKGKGYKGPSVPATKFP